MTIVCIIPFCIHIENKHQCGEKSMKFLKILAGSEDGGDLVLVVHYTSSDPANAQTLWVDWAFWVELNKENDGKTLLKLIFKLTEVNLSAKIHIYSIYMGIYITYLYTHIYSKHIPYIHIYGLHTSYCPPYSTPIMIWIYDKLGIGNSKKDFNFNVLNSKSAVPINLMH